MYEARVIGTDIKVRSKSMIYAYCLANMLGAIDARISMKYIPQSN